MRHLFECLNCASQRATNCQRRVGALSHGTKSICLSECQKRLLAFLAERFQEILFISCVFGPFYQKSTLMGILFAEPTLITRSAHKPGGAVTLMATFNEQMLQSEHFHFFTSRPAPANKKPKPKPKRALPASDSDQELRPRSRPCGADRRWERSTR